MLQKTSSTELPFELLQMIYSFCNIDTKVSLHKFVSFYPTKIKTQICPNFSNELDTIVKYQLHRQNLLQELSVTLTPA